MPNFGGRKVSYGTCLVRKTNAVDTMHTLVCDLIRRGHPVNMNAVNFPFGRHGVRVLHDLPHYPWNHQSRYWSEPRQNKAHRHRLDAPHDLLGSLVLGTNATAPSWRNIIKESDLPWVHDHLVQSNIVYPGAGFICMAIEGALQQASRAGATKKVVSYRLRDVDILQALVIPDTAEGVEVQLELRPCREKAIYAKGWKEFTVYSVSGDNKWTEHCQGLISVELASSASEDTPARWDDNNAWSAAYLPLTQPVKAVDYRMRIAARDIYAGMRSVGIYHGPIFQNLKSVRARHNQSTSVFEIADSASVMPHQHQHPHVLHPTTLDSVFQTAYTAMPESRSVMTSAMVPRFIKSMTVAHDIQSSPGHRFRSYADIIHKDSHSLETKIVVYDDRGEEEPGNDQRPLIQLNGFVLQSLGKAGSRSADPHENEKFSTVRWAPDITFLPPAYLKQELGCPIQPSEAEIIMDLRRACSYFIDDALASLTVDDIANLEWHHKKFYNWMKVQKELASTNQLAPGSSEWAHHSAAEKRALIEKVNAASVNGEMVCRLGPQILSMLRREITPLELMLEGKLLHRYYVDALKWDRSSRQMGELVRHYVHKQPRAKILEIGGGTGGTTTYNLNAIGSSDSGHGPLAASYDFTDISSGFFEAAQDKFQAWKDLVRYRKLDIEQDPASQGFETGTYDLIMASQVLHATKSMQHTMGNVHKLLKPGGKLFIMETTKDQLDLQLAFGLLPGWWLSEEEERKLSPSLSIDMWDRVLRRTGFSGVEMEVHDAEDENLYSFSVMMSTAMAPDAGASSADVLLVLGFQTPPQDWLEALQSSIVQVTGTRPAVEVSFPSANLHGKICIYLGDMGHSVLHDPDPEQFEALKVLCTQSKGLLWVTQGGMMEHEDLHASLSTGFLRSLREEYVGKYLVALDLDPKQEAWSRKSIDPLIAVLKNTLDHSAEETYRDFEFAERDGVLHVPRYVKDVARNEARAPDLDRNCTAARAPFEQPGRSLRLSVGTPGLLDTLAFSDDPDATTDLHPDQLEVEPRAFGVNFRDIMVAMGQLGSEQTMCFECAGVVKRAGANAAAQGFRAGDRIMTLLRGHYANLVRLPWTNAVHIPDSLSFETAASLPMVYTTAYVSLIETAQLEQGERVLIHAATGGVGQAAIVLAKLRGAEIFATVGTKEKRDFLVSKYGIAPDHIFSSRDTSFGPAVLAMTDGQGVDVVLNSLAGPLLQESFNCVAPFGRFVEIGKRDLEINSSLEMGAFNRAVSFFHMDLLQLEAHKGAQIQRVMKEIVRLFSEGSITTVDPVTVYPLSDLGKTFRLMQAGKHMGKIVVTVKADDLVPVSLP
jgi:NADPH:quinone reductase-like Zn-dependent oxidoreductase/ubiquinone/menaquinone biosynthesis C-methylase UbiE